MNKHSPSLPSPRKRGSKAQSAEDPRLRGEDKSTQQAWVVFSGETEISWLRVLKPGFRHCFVVLFDEAHWLTIDPLANHMDAQIQPLPADFNLPLWFKNRGLEVVPAPLNRTHKKPAPVMPLTCVETVKRILGLHHRFIFTPWQLYRYLLKEHCNEDRRNEDLAHASA